MITTNDIKPTGPAKPKKLNQVTSSDKQFEAKPVPKQVYRPADPNKTITTHEVGQPKKKPKKEK